MASSCEQDNKLSGSLKCGEFLEKVNIVSLRRTLFNEIIKRSFVGILTRLWVGRPHKFGSFPPGEIDTSPKHKD